jgi:tellurite resistance protein
VAETPLGTHSDWILKAMVAVAASDGKLDPSEVDLIRQIYRDQSGKTLSADEVASEAEAAGGDMVTNFAAAGDTLDKETKEEMIRAAYLVLLADDKIAGQERKRLQDLSVALKIPEIHFGAILEDLAVWMAHQKS